MAGVRIDRGSADDDSRPADPRGLRIANLESAWRGERLFLSPRYASPFAVTRDPLKCAIRHGRMARRNRSITQNQIESNQQYV